MTELRAAGNLRDAACDMLKTARSFAKSTIEAVLLASSSLPARQFANLPPLDAGNLTSMFDPAPREAEWLEVLQLMESCGIAPEADPHTANPGDKRAVYQIIRALRPRSVLELGTSAGISALFAVAALSRNFRETEVAAKFFTVDCRDPNARGDWKRAGLSAPPQVLADEISRDISVSFVEDRSEHYLATAGRTFDFIYLDASTSELGAYRNLVQLPHVVRRDSFVLLHVYYPEGRPIWPEEPAIPGPWRAIERLRRNGGRIGAYPLSELPWPTKRGTRRTSLAVIHGY